MRSLATTAVIAALLVIAPGAAGATTTTDTTAPTDSVPETTAPDTVVSSTTVLNILGTGITLDVELDPTGRLSSVSLVDDASGAPADPLADPEVTHESGHKVQILLGDDATSVQVQAGGNKVDTKVRTADLAGLVGSHTWTGELFGAGNGETSIGFTVSGTDGFPEVTLDSVAAGSDGVSATDRSWTETDDDGYEAKLRVDLTDGTDKARVVISVSVELDEDDGPHARLKISAHSRLLATERPHGPADDPDISVNGNEIGDDSDHDADDHEDESEDRGRSEDKRQDDRDRSEEKTQNSSSKNKGQDDDDHDDDSRDGSRNDDSKDHSDDGSSDDGHDADKHDGDHDKGDDD